MALAVPLAHFEVVVVLGCYTDPYKHSYVFRITDNIGVNKWKRL